MTTRFPPVADAPASRRWRLTPVQREELAIAFVFTVAVNLFPRWRPFAQAWAGDWLGLKAVPWAWYSATLFVVAAGLLALSSRERSGLVVGSIREHWRKVLLVCGGSIAVVALVYPRLPVQPFGGAPATMWTLSPIAQELFFLGWLYGRLERAFPGYVHPRLPLARALALTMVFFALWHLPNFHSVPAGYVLFQLFYTGVLGLVPGLSRQWTGSVWYAMATHAVINYIAWSA